MNSRLSMREQQIAIALANSRNLKSIAGDLGLSLKTAEAHLAAVYRKLRVRGLARLTRWAIARGLVFPMVCASLLAAPMTNPVPIYLEWDCPAEYLTNGTAFILYGTTNISSAITNWPAVGTVSGTNRLYFTVTPGAYFYTARASNFWGVSDFSTVAWTPAVPRDDVGLRVRKGQ